MIDLNYLKFFHRRKEILFDNLCFNLKSGSITGLLGKNGAGKTTLLKLIAGMIFPKDGKVEVMGYNPKKREPNFLKQLYYLPEELYLPNTSVKFYIKANAVFYPNFDYELMDIQMQKFEIPINNRLSKMSYGQKKKFLIAFALATKCKLLILDEPTNGLDIPSKSIFRKMLAGALSEDQLVLISTHQVKDVENLIDRIIILDHGQMIMNREIIDISEKYQFTTVRDTKSIEPLYEESGPIGSRVIVPGNGNSSSVDIELLFNATTSGIKLT